MKEVSYTANIEKDSTQSTFEKVSKVIGGTLLGGVAGLMAAKGFDHFVMNVEPGAVFEGAVAGAGALLAGFITAETTE